MQFAKKKKGNRFVSQVAGKKTSENKSGKNNKKIYLSLITIVVVGFFYLVFSSFLSIKNIIISDTKNIDGYVLEKTVWDYTAKKKLFIFPQSNLLMLDKQALINDLQSQFQIDSIKIKKRYPSTLKIELIEKDFQLVWFESDNYYYINRQGDIILTTQTKPEQTIIINNLVESKKGERKIEVSLDFLQGVEAINQAVTQAEPDLIISNYVYDEERNTIKLKIEEGPLVYFDYQGNIEQQLDKLLVLRKEVFLDDIDFKRQLYIDLRYGDRVFYK